MQLAPLRPRRRRNSAESVALREPSATPRSTSLSAVAARIAGLIDGPVSEALVVMLTELYGDALARVIAALEGASDRAEIMERMCADQLVGGLLVVHDLHPHSLTTRVQQALTSVTQSLADPPGVTLDRIQDDVVYLRLPHRIGAVERSAIARAIAAAAPEITHVRAAAAAGDDFALHAS